MLTLITKYTKSLSIKILVGIIILPFVFWGMGDLFRGGNQNVVATIDSKKINSKDFVNYLQRINVTEEERKNISKSDLVEKILSEYIGRIVLEIEIESNDINLSDNSLAQILKNNKLFQRDSKFSPLEYEKFILKNGITKVVFEENLREKEKKNQLLYYLSGGIIAPNILIENSYREENQIKYINYINLKNIYNQNIIKDEDIEKIYEENKDLFIQEFKNIEYAELKPGLLSIEKKYDESFFVEIDKIENNFLDGSTFGEIVSNYNLKSMTLNGINVNKKKINNSEVENIDEKLFKKIFSIKNVEKPELINLDNTYYIAQIKKIDKTPLGVKNSDVTNTIKSQLEFKNKIEKNIKIKQEIEKSLIGIDNLKNFALSNKLEIVSTKIDGIKDNKQFNEEFIKEIFKIKDNKIKLISDATLSKNFIVFSEKTEFLKFDKSSQDYEKYKIIANNKYANNIFKLYDKSVNSKYNVELKTKVINRIKNSF